MVVVRPGYCLEFHVQTKIQFRVYPSHVSPPPTLTLSIRKRSSKMRLPMAKQRTCKLRMIRLPTWRHDLTHGTYTIYNYPILSQVIITDIIPQLPWAPWFWPTGTKGSGGNIWAVNWTELFLNQWVWCQCLIASWICWLQPAVGSSSARPRGEQVQKSW